MCLENSPSFATDTHYIFLVQSDISRHLVYWTAFPGVYFFDWSIAIGLHHKTICFLPQCAIFDRKRAIQLLADRYGLNFLHRFNGRSDRRFIPKRIALSSPGHW